MNKSENSALYVGHVSHLRLSPRRHSLSYKIYSLLLDLDELDTLNSRLKLFSVDRFNLFSFYRKDRGDGTDRPLRVQIEAFMRDAGLEPDGGKILLLTMPRILGWSFNPLSIFFCFDRAGKAVGILWEVDNTFGERHGYMLPVRDEPSAEIVQACNKAFYVSPFMDMNMRYDFRVSLPSQTFALKIDTSDKTGLVLTARHVAKRKELNDRALLAAFLKIPFLTLRVLGGIHWEALKILLKGIAMRPRPPAPAEPVSVDRLR